MILVDKHRVEPNEILKANCTSGASHPAPNVTWTLNGAAVSTHYYYVTFFYNSNSLLYFYLNFTLKTLLWH